MYPLFTFLLGVATIATIIGLVKPRVVRLRSRKMVLGVGFVAIIAFTAITSMLETDEHRA